MATAQEFKGETFKFPDQVAPLAAQESEEKIDITVEGVPEIEIVDDTPEADKGRRALEKEPDEPTENELADYSEKVRKRIKELDHARHDERRAKEAALREREEMERITRATVEENKRLKQYVQTGEKAYATTLQTSAEAKLEMAKRKYKEAHEAYDTDAILAAQQELTEAQWELANAKNFRPTPLQTEETDVNSQITEQATVRPDEKTLRWQARNQWFGAEGESEELMTAHALALHRQLVKKQFDPRSDEYFAAIDEHIHRAFPDYFGETPPPKSEQPTRQRPASVVAPASRSASGASKVKLTATAAALIKKLGISEQDYAKQMIALEKQNG